MPTRPAEPPDQERERRRRSAKALWLGAAGGVLGTPVDTYLCGRGLDLRRLDDAAARLGLPPRAGGYRPRALRYLAQAACSGGLYPAMVACVLAGSGRFLGVHRTFLDPGGAGKAVLPDGGPAKRTLGPTGGGFVPIWRGASGRPWLHAPEGDELAICEGIEDALTLAMAAPELRVVAALSAGNLAALALPPAFGRLLIGADNDAPGSPADRSLAQAIRRWQSEGRSVRLARAGDGAKDFNARLLQRVKSAPSA